MHPSTIFPKVNILHKFIIVTKPEDTVDIYPLYSHFTRLICTHFCVCVYLVICNIITIVDVYEQHFSQGTKQFHNKDPSCYGGRGGEKGGKGRRGQERRGEKCRNYQTLQNMLFPQILLPHFCDGPLAYSELVGELPI